MGQAFLFALAFNCGWAGARVYGGVGWIDALAVFAIASATQAVLMLAIVGARTALQHHQETK